MAYDNNSDGTNWIDIDINSFREATREKLGDSSEGLCIAILQIINKGYIDKEDYFQLLDGCSRL